LTSSTPLDRRLGHPCSSSTNAERRGVEDPVQPANDVVIVQSALQVLDEGLLQILRRLQPLQGRDRRPADHRRLVHEEPLRRVEIRRPGRGGHLGECGLDQFEVVRFKEAVDDPLRPTGDLERRLGRGDLRD
jgi:hypothetical protein